MNIVEAYYLLQSSSSYGAQGDRNPAPAITLTELSQWTRTGVRQATSPDGKTTLVFNVDRIHEMLEILESPLYESPEKIGKHNRHDYRFHLFVGDAHGCFVGDSSPYHSHGEMMRDLVRTGAVVKREDESGNAVGYGVADLALWPGSVIGNPESMDAEFSGTILPRHPGVDGTYLSFWTSGAFSALGGPVLDFARSKFEAPFFFDTTDTDYRGTFTIKPA